MPIESVINSQEKMVYTTCSGIVYIEDFFKYQKDVWGHNDYFGYNELFDTTEADWSEFEFGTLFEVIKGAAKLSSLDPNSKFAWVVLEGKQRALTDFYKSAKELSQGSSRQLESFYNREDALKWLKY